MCFIYLMFNTASQHKVVYQYCTMYVHIIAGIVSLLIVNEIKIK